MLRVDDSARRRFAMFGGVMGVFLGGLIVSGVIERFANPTVAEARVDPDEINRVREQTEKSRQIRAEAATIGRKGRWDDTVRFLDDAGKENGVTPYLRAEAALRAGRLEEAKKGFLQFMPSEDPVSYGTRLLLSGNIAEYHAFCEKTLADVAARQPSAMEANNAAWLCALAPDALSDYSKAIELAKIASVQANEGDRANNLNTLGVVEYRAGHYQEAIEVLQEADKLQQEPFNWPFLALSYHQLGDETNARLYYTRLRNHLNSTFGKPPGMNRHELLLFFQEAESVFGDAPTTPK